MEEHQARCNEIQVLKFGQLIDLEMVDKVRCAVSLLLGRRFLSVPRLLRYTGRNARSIFVTVIVCLCCHY